MIYALRWPIDRPAAGTTVSDGFFRTLADLVVRSAGSRSAAEPSDVRASDRRRRDGLHQGASRLGDRRRGEPRGRGVGAHAAPAVPGHARICRGAHIFCMPGCCGRWRCWPRRASRCRRRRRRSASTASARSRAAFTQFCGETPSHLPQKGCRREGLNGRSSLFRLAEQSFAQQHGDRSVPPLKLRGTGQRLGQVAARCGRAE